MNNYLESSTETINNLVAVNENKTLLNPLNGMNAHILQHNYENINNMCLKDPNDIPIINVMENGSRDMPSSQTILIRTFQVSSGNSTDSEHGNLNAKTDVTSVLNPQSLLRKVDNILCTSIKESKCDADSYNDSDSKEETLFTGLNAELTERAYECKFCSKKFSNKQNCDRHYRTHTNDKPYKCDICEKRFPFQRSRDRHYRIHTNVKAYECNICGKKFSRNQGLKSHYLTHTKEKPHECEICHKRFPRIGSLRQHYRLHTNEKPYDCEACGKSFALKRNRDKHYRVVHMNEKPFICEECDKRFSCKSTLECHYSTHTNEKHFLCEMCNKRYSHKASLTLHYKQHIN